MASHILLTQVALPRDTGLPEDVTVNTFHWLWDDTQVGYTDSTLVSAVIKTRLDTFYAAVDQLLSANLATPGTYKNYDLGDPIPREPFGTAATAGLTFGTASLPEECAICVSYYAASASGSHRARRRGRIYLGPLDQGLGLVSNGRYLLTSANRTTIANAASALQGANNAGLKWSVYSRVDDDAFPVVGGWVDDAFDVQRRRGPQASARTTFGVLP